MTGWLLDTNILSELRRPKPEAKVARLRRRPTARPALCQRRDARRNPLRNRARRRRHPPRRTDDWLAHKVRPMFEQRVLPVSEDIMFKWRLLVEDGRKAGHTFSQPDLIIAATALYHGLTVVSRDVSDYKSARAPVFNPWQ